MPADLKPFRKVAHLNPWGENGFYREFKINGHTGLISTIGGGDLIPFNDVKDMKSFGVFDSYDYLIIPFWGGFYEILQKIKATSRVKIIAVGDVELNALPYAPRTELTKLVKCAKLCDIFLTSNPDSFSLFSSIRPDGTHDLMGWCIFPEIHSQLIKDPSMKEPNHISVGCSNSGYNRNVLENFIIFKKLLVAYPSLTGHYWCVHPNNDNELIDLADEIGVTKNLVLHREKPYAQFLADFSSMYISIHLYTFNVVSRLAQDAMALGIPHVGSTSNFSDRAFCPMSAPPFDVNTAHYNADQLLKDRKLYSMVRMEQLAAVSHYSSNVIGERIKHSILAFEEKNK